MLVRIQTGNLKGWEALASVGERNPGGPEAAIVLEALVRGGIRAADSELASWALDLWQKHRTSDLDQARGLIWRGELDEVHGDFFQAISNYEKAIALAPEYIPAVGADSLNQGACTANMIRGQWVQPVT